MSFMPMDGGPKVPGIGVEASVNVPEVKASGLPGADLAHVAGGSLGGVLGGATPGIVGAGGPNLAGAAEGIAGGALGSIGASTGGLSGVAIGDFASGAASVHLPDLRNAAGGIVGGTLGGAVTGIAGGTLGGAVGGIAGSAISGVSNIGATIEGIAVGAVGGVVGGIVDKAVTGAVGKIAGDIVGNIAGDLAGGLAGAISGGAIQATLDGVLGGAKGKLEAAAELPVFDDIAVTASDPKKLMKGAAAKAEGALGRIVKDGARKLGNKNFEVTIGSGDKLDVRQFSIHERLSSLFQVNLVAVSDNPSIEFDDVVGQPTKFSMSAGMHDKFWSGVCNHFEQVRHEPGGLSTYQFSIVPTLWLLTQRKNHRMHQQISEPDIVLKMLKEWGIKPVEQYDKGSYKKRKYRVQYNESDFAFICRMLEDAGITFYFQQGGDETELVLSDAPHSNPPRGESLAFKDDTSLTNAVQLEFVTGVRTGQRVRPGKYTMRDHDYRKPPTYKLLSTAAKGLPMEEKLERFQYVPGAFLFGADSGDGTPSADDKGKARTDEKEAAILAQKRLDAKRGSARTATFETNAHDLAPGVVLSISGHAHGALSDDKKLLVVESSLSGTTSGEWSQHCEVRGTEIPFRPELVTPRPKTQGIESATVVGPAGEEIHCDEFGRVRCHFHWDRESQMDDNSSCWIHVSQPWGGAGYGGSALPRIGQEVLVDFLGGDPDRPVIVGRLYTNLQKTPYKLPDNKTQSGLKSNSTGNTGGYNELMFEDTAGKELLRMQAEKDLNKLVKNDEQVKIGRDRQKNVARDDQHDVGRDRQRSVGRDESVHVGQDRTRQVGRDESVDVGQDQKKKIGRNQDMTVGQDLTKNVGSNERETTGQNRTVSVGQNRTAEIGLVDSTSVGEKVYVEVKPPEGEPEEIDDLGEVDGVEDNYVQQMANLGQVGGFGGAGFAGGPVGIMQGLAGGAGASGSMAGMAGGATNMIAGAMQGAGGAAAGVMNMVAGAAQNGEPAVDGARAVMNAMGGMGGGVVGRLGGPPGGVMNVVSGAAGGAARDVSAMGLPDAMVQAAVRMARGSGEGENSESQGSHEFIHALIGMAQSGVGNGSNGPSSEVVESIAGLMQHGGHHAPAEAMGALAGMMKGGIIGGEAAGTVMNAIGGMMKGGATGVEAAGAAMGAIGELTKSGAMGGEAAGAMMNALGGMMPGGGPGGALGALAGAAGGGGLGGLTGMLGGQAARDAAAGVLGKAAGTTFGDGALAKKASAAEQASAKQSKAIPTSMTMVHKKITITTGHGATITMDGAKVTIEADTIEFFARKNIQADAQKEDVSIHAKKDIALNSDQTMHMATKKGLIAMSAAGGNVTVSSDQNVAVTATSSFSAIAKTASVAASTSASLTGGSNVFIGSQLTLTLGVSALIGIGGSASMTGMQQAAVTSGGPILVQGSLVNINP